MKTVLQDNYINYLNKIKTISNVEKWEADFIKFKYQIDDKFYDFIFCGIDEFKLPAVLLCNPKGEILEKPHLMQIKKNELLGLCLSIKDDISIKNKDYEAIIDYTLARIKRLITMSVQEERREFRKEFLYFWNENAINKEENIQLFLKSSSTIRVLNSWSNKKTVMFIDKEIELNKIFLYQYKKDSNKIVYIPLINSSLLEPPTTHRKWKLADISNIFKYCISEENIETLEQLSLNTKKLTIIFEMNVPGVVPITFALRIKFKNDKYNDLVKSIDEILSFEHLKTERCDEEYLFKRIGVRNKIKDKKVLIVGIGSLGSYIVSELPKLGVRDMTIVDADKMYMENVMRHFLGASGVDSSKVWSMKFELERNYPELKVEIRDEMFDVNNIEGYNLTQYDLIIIATGGTDYMLKINKFLKNQNIKIPILFTWIEAQGIGVHALICDYNRKGCFNCLYHKSEHNKAHFSHKVYKGNLTGTGCGGTINQYGSLVLLKGSSMILNIILDLLNSNKINDNLLFSVKTTSDYVINENYISYGGEVKGRTSYISEGCEICGKNI